MKKSKNNKDSIRGKINASDDAFRLKANSVIVQGFLAFLAVAAFILCIVLCNDTPIHSQKVNLIVVFTLLGAFVLLLLAEIFFMSSGDLLVIEKRGITVRTGGITKIFSPEKRDCFLPWEDIHAIVKLRQTQLYMTGYTAFTGKSNWIYIVPASERPSSYKKIYSLSLSYISHNDELILEDTIRICKPDYIAEKRPEAPLLFNYINTTNQINSQVKVEKLRKQAKLYNNRIAWFIIISIISLSIPLMKSYFDAKDTFFYNKFFCEYVMKFDVPDNWQRGEYQDRTDIDYGHYTVMNTINRRVNPDFNPKTKVFIRSGKSPNYPAFLNEDDYNALKIGEWEYLTHENISQKILLTDRSITNPKSYIKQTREDYIEIRTHRYVYEGKEELLGSVIITTEILFECEKIDFSIIIETSERQERFGENIEKDETFSTMRRLHNDAVADALKAIAIDKPSKL